MSFNVFWKKNPPQDLSSYVPPSDVDERRNLFSPVDFYERRTTNDARLNLWSSIALRFADSRRTVRDILAPLANNPDAGSVAPYFFSEKLGALAEIAAANRFANKKILADEVSSIVSPYGELIRVGCGDMEAVAPAIESVESVDARQMGPIIKCAVKLADLRPREARLVLKNIFTRADNKDRLTIIRIFADDARLTSNQTLGEMFIQLMARSTPEERREEIYPYLAGLIKGDCSRAGRPLLRALLLGWLSEDDQAGEIMRDVVRDV